MACASCGQRMYSAPVVNTANNNYVASQMTSAADCPYTVDQLKIWAQKLTCFQQKGLYVQYNIPPSALNRALGDVLSAINYPSNPCYYQKKLDSAQALIMIVIGSGQC